VFRTLGDLLPGGSNMNARSQWYGRAFARDDNAATVYYEGVGRARGSVMLSIRQSWFEQLPGDPVPSIAPMLTGWHVSRVDLAADTPADTALPPAELYARLPTARSRSRSAHRVLTMAWDGAQKLTIGSRASERYVRVYIKGDRIRHELEMKGVAAGDAWAALAGGATPARVWTAEYGRVVQWRA